MLEVRLGAQDRLYILDVEAELLDARGDERRTVREAAVDEHVALRARDQENRDVLASDVIQVAGNAERCHVGLMGLRIVLLNGDAPRHEQRGKDAEAGDEPALLVTNHLELSSSAYAPRRGFAGMSRTRCCTPWPPGWIFSMMWLKMQDVLLKP